MGTRVSRAFAGVPSAVRDAGASSRQMEYRSRAWFLYGGWRDQPFLADNFGRNRGERLRLYRAGARPRFRRRVAWWDTRLLLRDARAEGGDCDQAPLPIPNSGKTWIRRLRTCEKLEASNGLTR